MMIKKQLVVGEIGMATKFHPVGLGELFLERTGLGITG
jgi:hypothetical protein